MHFDMFLSMLPNTYFSILFVFITPVHTCICTSAIYVVYTTFSNPSILH